MLIINKNHLFNEVDIKDLELIEYENYKEDTIYLERETFEHFKMLQSHLKVDNIIIDIKDGYRSLEKQESIFLSYLNKYSYEEILEFIDEPGTSDYHTAQSIGFTLKIDNKWIDDYEMLNKYKKILKKIHKDLKYFGFVIRYPNGKEHITFHRYEPWHIRYVGEEANNINSTIEEYVEKRGF